MGWGLTWERALGWLFFGGKIKNFIINYNIQIITYLIFISSFFQFKFILQKLPYPTHLKILRLFCINVLYCMCSWEGVYLIMCFASDLKFAKLYLDQHSIPVAELSKNQNCLDPCSHKEREIKINIIFSFIRNPQVKTNNLCFSGHPRPWPLNST